MLTNPVSPDGGPPQAWTPPDAPAVWTALAEASADGLIVVSPTGQILVRNRRFAEVWGLSDDDLAADDATALAAARDLVADPEAFSTRVSQIYADPAQPSHDEIVLRDGRVLDRYGAPLRDAAGGYLGWAWHFRDVTPAKTTEADLRRLAQTLQASLLPPRPPTIPGLEVATRYQPAAEDAAVGGDFFDVFRLRTNDWGLVLGDVCGKGVGAARLTALARYTLRAAAGHHEGPADILRDLNDTLLDDDDIGERFVSAVYGKLEQDVCGAWITLAAAGHPLPFVVRRAGWIDLRGQAGSLLGLFGDIDLAEDRVGLGPGDSIVLCTDGITEARNAAGEEFGDEALPEVLLANTAADAEGLADAILTAATAFTSGAHNDDVALLIVRVPDVAADPATRLQQAGDGNALPVPGYPVGEPHWGATWRPRPPREARLILDGAATGAARARRFVVGVLHSWRLSTLVGGDVELLTSELVGNAIRHGESPFSVIVGYDGQRVRIQVGDGSPALPRRRDPGPDSTGGRGVQIVGEVAAAWGVTPTVAGKRVWFELPVPAAAAGSLSDGGTD